MKEEDPMGRLLGEARARELLGRGPEARILIVGDLMLDHYISGRVERISPEAPVPVLRVEGEETRLGGAANVAANVRALGASCDLVGCTGDDEGHDRLVGALERLGMESGGVVRAPDRPTTVKSRLVARSQQVARFDRESDRPIPAGVEQELLEQVDLRMADASAVAIEDYNKGVLTPRVIAAIVARARECEVPLVVDPKRHHFFDFAGATLFKPNLRELEDAMGRPPEPSRRAWLDEVREAVGAEHLLLTLGEGGMTLHGPDAPALHLPATARSVYDVSGAGDTVTAVMAVALAVGARLREGAVLANVAAGVGVGKAGVVPVTPQEILAALASDADDPPHVDEREHAAPSILHHHPKGPP